MKRIYFHTIISAVLAVFLVACSADEPSSKEMHKSDRTVLVYMIANNDLGDDGYDREDLAEMQKAVDAGDLGDNGRWLVYHASPDGKTALKEVVPGEIRTLKTYSSDILSVDRQRMDEVFRDAAELAPSDSWGLIFWSHASGWKQDGLSRSSDDIPTEYSYGEDRDNGIYYKMNTSTLAEAVTTAPFCPEFIYFDCCYMASVEALYDLRHTAPLIVGSATELPAKGMPYDVNIAHFMKMPKADVRAAAASTFAYYDALSGSARTCTMSIVDTDALDDLAAATKAIYSTFDGTMPAGYHPQCFQSKPEASCIYFDFKDYIHAICSDAKLLEDFDDAFSRTVTYSAATPNLWYFTSLARHNGLSTYILRDTTSSSKFNYSSLAWYRDIASSINFQQ